MRTREKIDVVNDINFLNRVEARHQVRTAINPPRSPNAGRGTELAILLGI